MLGNIRRSRRILPFDRLEVVIKEEVKTGKLTKEGSDMMLTALAIAEEMRKCEFQLRTRGCWTNIAALKASIQRGHKNDKQV